MSNSGLVHAWARDVHAGDSFAIFVFLYAALIHVHAHAMPAFQSSRVISREKSVACRGTVRDLFWPYDIVEDV